MKPVLYIMSGLSFSGKTTLAKQLIKPLHAELLSYDFDIWSVYKTTLPPDISKTDEWVTLETTARERIAALLEAGKNIIFDDLNVEKRDRDALRETAYASNAHSLVIYMDVPAEVAIERQKTNDVTRGRGL